jgi:GxxExxY protein
LDALTEAIIGCAIDVHRSLGPGLLESAYDNCLAFALTRRDLKVERQKPIPLVYEGNAVGLGYRLDLMIEDLVVVEVKAVQRLEKVHSAQLLSYLRLTGCSVGLVFNFNVRVLTQGGVKRVVNGFPE